jgi:hypothetical protein
MTTEIITRLERSLESETRLYRDFRQRREADELRRFDEILRHFKLLTNQVRKGQKEQNRLLTLLLESKGRDGS